MESFDLSRSNFWDCAYQNNGSMVRFKLFFETSRDNLNYDQFSDNYRHAIILKYFLQVMKNE